MWQFLEGEWQMNEEEYADKLDDEIASREQELEELHEDKEDIESGYTPESNVKDSFLKFFRDILKSKDSIKTAFFNKGEVGKPQYTINGGSDLIKLCEVNQLPEVAQYFRDLNENTARASMGREGAFMTTTITRKSETKKSRSSGSWDDKKKGILGFGKKKEGDE